MELDFSALEKLNAGSRTAGRQRTPVNTVLLAERAEREQLRKLCAEFQENIKRAGTLRNDILIGIQSGEELVKILLTALECISLMTNNKSFFEQAAEDIDIVYKGSAAKVNEHKLRMLYERLRSRYGKE